MKGFLAIGRENRATVIHVHGSCGNFYENDFIPFMAENYTSNGMNFLAVNNRGHDCIAEVYRNGKVEYIGGYHEVIEECIYDIDGAIDFANQLGSQIILQGHSLGCLKVLMYLVKQEKPFDFVLLSPSDSYQLQSDYIHPETVEEQVERISGQYKDRPSAMLPREEFGIREKDLEYHIPTSPRAFLSLFGNNRTRLLAYKQNPNYVVNARGFVYYGIADRLQTETSETVRQFFQKRVKEVKLLVCKDGDHHFHGLESDVTRQISEWAARA